MSDHQKGIIGRGAQLLKGGKHRAYKMATKGRERYESLRSKRLVQLAVRPDVRSSDETLDRICSEDVSISRFGDGEFNYIMGRHIKYQQHDERLASALRGILKSTTANHLVCIPDAFGGNQWMKSWPRQYWREVLDAERGKIYDLLALEATYYDTFVSRPFKDSLHPPRAERLFDRWKSVWDEKDLLIVEGQFSRLGVGNDLFNNASSIRRILGPAENSFTVYDQLLQSAEHHHTENSLTLLALGPTATALSYELAIGGIRSIDIGHIDVEYEWFQRGMYDIPIPGKYVNESVGGRGREKSASTDATYLSQIVDEVLF